MNSNLALKDFQVETPAPSLAIVPKVAVGSVVTWQWNEETYELPILAIHKDFFGRVSTYTVPSVFAEQGVWMRISATNTRHILSISEPRPFEGKIWYLLAAYKAGERSAQWRKYASLNKPVVVSLTDIEAVKTARGYGFYSQVESDWVYGDEAKHQRYEKNAAYWQAVYFMLIEMYKSGKA